MNDTVATSERVENRDRPQMPWPLVQPLPSVVPKPTKRPPITMIGIGLVTRLVALIGDAISALAFGQTDTIIFVATMLVGMVICRVSRLN